jgi:AAA+ ATPase superfamily predicted ATPase
MAAWNFYGRTEPLADLSRIVSSGRRFFCRIEGRRRIGKTTLISHLARNNATLSNHLVYMQVPDSDERDVAATFQRALKDSDHTCRRGQKRCFCFRQYSQTATAIALPATDMLHVT